MISSCPKCLKQVTISRGLAPTALVRCPLCEEEYFLSESLDLVPPELILVESDPSWGAEVAGEEEEWESAGANDAAVVTEDFPALPSAAHLRPKKQKSALRVLFEIVAGGLAGCLVAYYALAFYFGPEFKKVGLPDLHLPFISWITAPPAKEKGEKSNPTDEKDLDATPDQSSKSRDRWPPPLKQPFSRIYKPHFSPHGDILARMQCQ